MMNELYPLTLEPMVAEQIWSRSSEMPSGDGLPPSFLGTLLMAATGSKILFGPEAGRSLSYLRQIWGPELTGTEAGGDYDGPLPVELKLRRTGESALAVGLDGDSWWYFLAAAEHSSLNAGFRPGLDFAAAGQEAGGDPGRWAEHMPEFEVEAGGALKLPAYSPLLLGAGLTAAQISRPRRTLANWPLAGPSAEDLTLAAQSAPPQWLKTDLGDEALVLENSGGLKISLICAAQLSGAVNPEAATFLWPIAGQGRIRTRGPAPTTRLTPGRVVMLPAALGRYAVESGGRLTYLLIEASSLKS